MKKVVLFLALFICFSTIAISQCTVNPFIEDNHTLYAKFLALREIQGNPEYVFRTPYNRMHLAAETTAPWLDDFINTGISGNATLDDLVATYGFYVDENYVIGSNTILELRTDMNALEDDFLAVDNVLTALSDVNIQDRLNYDGIPLTINNENVESSDITVVNSSYPFCLYAGDCLAGCLYWECCTIDVSEDSNTVVLGVSESDLNTFAIYPNPSSNIIHIHGVTSEINTTLIYSGAGHLMYATTSNSETIDISNLSAGMYFPELRTSEGDKQMLKFIKN